MADKLTNPCFISLTCLCCVIHRPSIALVFSGSNPPPSKGGLSYTSHRYIKKVDLKIGRKGKVYYNNIIGL
jgi:hypothetical protein